MHSILEFASKSLELFCISFPSRISPNKNNLTQDRGGTALAYSVGDRKFAGLNTANTTLPELLS